MLSIIFGIGHSGELAVEKRELLALAHSTDQHAVDGTFVEASGNVGMGFQPYHTHPRSSRESQPTIDGQGNMVTLDGRLDNHSELEDVLGIQNSETTDSLIVLAAFARWGEECFSHFVGDWAIALWSHTDRSLYLARDHAGSRTLYFEQTGAHIVWSTCLETFFVKRKSRALTEGFAACYLASRAIGHLTPYEGISAVTPAHYLVFRQGQLHCKPHWSPFVKDTIVYKQDAEYQEHFLTLFRKSVERRTGLDTAILAELSGGMDSTSIVCISDALRLASGLDKAPRLDTVSYFDDDEPDWNERPYVSAVEAARQKTGLHIENSFLDYTFAPSEFSDDAYLFPGADRAFAERENYFEALTAGRGYRVILSGIGGDEVLGGVPTPFPSLADHLVKGNFREVVSEGVAWCIPSRTPILRLLATSLTFSLALYTRPNGAKRSRPPWLTAKTRLSCEDHTQKIRPLLDRVRMMPSAISNALAWATVLDTLARKVPARHVRREYRYPYLDQDLVNFLFRIPRSQLVRPGRRRFLMRSSLKGIVPIAILERKRKAFLIRRPLILLQAASEAIKLLISESVAVELGLVDRNRLLAGLDSVVAGQHPEWAADIARVVYFELWSQGRLHGGVKGRLESAIRSQA